MEHNKFELNEDALDQVTGGASTDEVASGFRIGDRVKFVRSQDCPSCRKYHKYGNPTGTITEAGGHRGCTMITVVFDCCNGDTWIEDTNFASFFERI